LGVVTSTFLDQVEREDFNKSFTVNRDFVQGCGAILNRRKPDL
jgi:hypothetical protein